MGKVIETVRNITGQLAPKVLPYAKAYIALVVGSLVAYLAQHGIEVPAETSEALIAGAYGFVVALWVWFVPNK